MEIPRDRVAANFLKLAGTVSLENEETCRQKFVQSLKQDSPHVNERVSRQEIFRTILVTTLPWLTAILVGFATALTGAYIHVNAEWFADLRTGYCRNLWSAGKNLCCGGGYFFDLQRDRCREFDYERLDDTVFSRVEWRPHTILPFVFYILFSALLSSTAGFFVLHYAKGTRGSGIPEVKAAVAGFQAQEAFRVKSLLIKTLGLILAVASGLALGKEGPLIHIGSTWAVLSKQFVLFLRDFKKDYRDESTSASRNYLSRHELLCIGSAAGVATAFAAPLGGVIFVIEELGIARSGGVSRRILIYCFLAAFTSAFFLKYLDLAGANTVTMFEISHRREWLAWEGIPFIFLGCLGGLVGAGFCRLNYVICKLRKSDSLWFLPKFLNDELTRRLPRCFLKEQKMTSTFRGVFEIFCLTFFTAAINYSSSAMLRPLMNNSIYAMFESCGSVRSRVVGLCETNEHVPKGGNSGDMLKLAGILLIPAVVRFFQTALTFGIAVPAGLFIPSLYIGACIGRFVGHFSRYNSLLETSEHVEPGVYAMVGATATLAGFTRMTISLVVIMCELTGGTYIVPFMLAVITAKLVADLFSTNCYDLHAKLLGFAAVEPLEFRFSQITVSDFVRNETPALILRPEKTYTRGEFIELYRDQKIVLVDDSGVTSLVDKEAFELFVREMEHEVRFADLDFEELNFVTTNFVELAHDAPAQTAYLAFSQNLNLDFIVVEEFDSFKFLSREDFVTLCLYEKDGRLKNIPVVSPKLTCFA